MKGTEQLVEKRLEYLLAHSPAVFYSCHIGKEWACSYISDNIKSQLGYEPKEFCQDGKFWAEHIHPDDRERIFEGLSHLTETGRYVDEYRFRNRGGEYRWMRDELILIRDEKGEPVDCIGFWIDITARKNAERTIEASLKEKEVLLREIHHRVKNNLQLISSMLSLQEGYIADKQALGFFRESRDRIRSMALVHEKLYQSGDLARIDFAEYVAALGKDLFTSYNPDPERIRLKADIKDLFLDVDKAIYCALIINELVSNALKYAFPGEMSGEIVITARTGEHDVVSLIVADNGIGLADSRDLREFESLGIQLVLLLVDQLSGTIDLEGNGGTSFRVSFHG